MSKPSPARYRTTNWSSYNASLRKRGSLLIWIDKDMTWRAPRKGGHARIGLVHLSAETAKAAQAGLTDTFQLGTYLTAAGRGKPDADTFLCHLTISLVGHTSFRMETRSGQA